MPIINTGTRLYCIIGNPVKHSFSPALHNAAFEALGINAIYTAFEVSDLSGAMAGFRALGIAGASVTIPHKIAVMPFLDSVSEIAGITGAVNTIINNNGKLEGTNTDAIGLFKALRNHTEIDGKTIAVLGSGGSARAACFALLYYALPHKVIILARNRNTREELKAQLIKGILPVKEYKEDCLETRSISDWEKIKNSVDIIINTTPVGMVHNTTPVGMVEIPTPVGMAPNDESILNKDQIPEDIVVMDIVYRPHKTKLLQYASEKGCRVVFGIEMLLYQGVEQFALWTGLEAPIPVMKEALRTAIGR
jgi:shikimate dehydrogenase